VRSATGVAVGLLLAAPFAFAAPLAFAWGPQGHRTIGAIADRLLTPEAHAQVLQILADDRDKFGNASGRTTLESVSLWADEVRGSAADRPSWHYDDFPVCGTVDKARYCPDGQCNSEQLKRLIAVLGDTHAPPRERDEALKWIVHLVGDIHQPLHAADNADHGGNLVPVVLEGVHTRGRENLHRAWDNDLVQLALHTRDHQRPPPDIDALAAEALHLGREVGEGTPDSWALESNNLARNVAYHYPGFACHSVPPGIVALDSTYFDDAELVVRERLLLAGARLATLLNSTLAQAQHVSPRRLR
jgi:nuclease S1